MEKSRVAQRQQQFAEQLEQLERELQELEAARNKAKSSLHAAAPVDAAASDVTQASNAASRTHTSVELLQQRIVRVTYRIAELCGRYQDYKLAALYYTRVLEWLDAREVARREALSPQSAPALARTKSKAFVDSRRSGLVDNNNNDSGAAAASVSNSTLPPPPPLTDTDVQLKDNVLNNLAVMHFGAGDRAQAMVYLLDAKKHVRERLASEQAQGAAQDSDNADSFALAQCDCASSRELERILTANYALFLHANDHVDDAIHAASAVIEPESLTRRDAESTTSAEEVRANVTALSCTLPRKSACHQCEYPRV